MFKIKITLFSCSGETTIITRASLPKLNMIRRLQQLTQDNSKVSCCKPSVVVEVLDI